jgi:hypothetical protein
VSTGWPPPRPLPPPPIGTPQDRPRARRCGAAVAAGVLILVTTVPMFVAGFLLTVLGMLIAGGVDGADLPVRDDITVLSGLVLSVGLLLIAAAVWGVIVGIGVLRRWRWARIAAIVTFSAYSTISLLGMIADGEAPLAALAWLGVCVAILVLLSLGGAGA